MIAADLNTLKHAAELLEADARDLRECHNLDPQQPDWQDEPEARIAHDDALCTALRLRVLARRMKCKQATDIAHLVSFEQASVLADTLLDAGVAPAPSIGDRNG